MLRTLTHAGEVCDPGVVPIFIGDYLGGGPVTGPCMPVLARSITDQPLLRNRRVRISNLTINDSGAWEVTLFELPKWEK